MTTTGRVKARYEDALEGAAKILAGNILTRHMGGPGGEAAFAPPEQKAAGTTQPTSSAEPFCACGRVRSECDGSRAGCRKSASSADPGHWLPRLRATFTIEPHVNGGCSTCEGTGVVENDDPDPEYTNPWDAPKMACPKCDGEGLQLCEADDCRELARRIVRGGHVRKMCCAHAACTLQLIEETLRDTWSMHRNVAANLMKDCAR